MPDMMRRKFLTGALVGSALLGSVVQAAAIIDTRRRARAWHDWWEPRVPLRRWREPRWRRLPPVERDWANVTGYRAANAAALAGPASARRVVMMGDSITENWRRFTGDFFADHGVLARGIGGQTSAQMLLRFWSDVLTLKPEAVHIMAGTNDIVGSPEPYAAVGTQSNLEAMALLAKAHGIAVVMASVPPASGFARAGARDDLKALNAWINDLCGKNGYTYCDYWPVLEAAGGKLKPELGLDTVHPNDDGYAVMGPVLLAAIDAALKKSG